MATLEFRFDVTINNRVGQMMKNNDPSNIAAVSVMQHKKRIVRLRILSVLMCITAFITTYAMILPAITASAEYSSDLSKFVDSVSIRDSAGNDIELGGLVYIGDDYTIDISFSEKGSVDNNKQFKYNENGCMTFQIPGEFATSPVTNGVITNDSGDNVGTYDIDSSGLMTVRFKDGFIEHTNKASLNVQLSAKVSENHTTGEQHIDFGDYTVDIMLSADGTLDVNKEASHYDLSTHTVDYEVKVKAKHGSISGINYQDTCAQGMTLVEGSVKYYSLDGQTQYDNYPTSLQSNEGFIIKYSMKIDDSVFENQGKRVFNADNTINVSGTNGEEKPVNVSDDATQKVTSEFLSKSGHLDNSNGTPRIRWTVTVGDGYTPVDGLVVKDILGEGLSFDTSEQIKITPYRYNPETDKLESHSSVYLSFPLSGPDENDVVIPSDLDATRCTITYYTTYDIEEGQEKTFTNTVKTTDNTRGTVEETGSIKVDETGQPPNNIQKSVELSEDGNSLHYTVGVDVYKSWYGKKNVYFEDSFTAVIVGEDRYFFGWGAENFTVKVTYEDGTEKPYALAGNNQEDDTFHPLRSSSDPRVNRVIFNYPGKSLSNSVWKENENVRLTVEFDLPLSTHLFTRDSSNEYTETQKTVRDILDLAFPIDNTALFYYSEKMHIDDTAQYVEQPDEPLKKHGKDQSDGTIDYTVTFDNNVAATSLLANNGTTYKFTDELKSSAMSYRDGTLRCTAYRANGTVYAEYMFNGSFADYETTPISEGAVKRIEIPFSAFEWFSGSSNNSDLQEFCESGTRQKDTSRIVFCYTVDVDKQSEVFQSKEQYIELKNQAEITGEKSGSEPYSAGPAESIVQFPNKILDKSVEQLDNSNRARFTITLNPSGADLVDNSDEFIIVDRMSENLKLVLSTVSARKKEGTEFVDITDLHYTYDKDNNIVRFWLPDEKFIIIEYETLIDAPLNSAVQVVNSVELEGLSGFTGITDETFTVQNTGGTADDGVFVLPILKQDSLTHEPLENAVFALYGPNDDLAKPPPEGVAPTVVTNGQTLLYYSSFTSDQNGYIEIGRENNTPLFYDGELYALVETKAPTGYILNDKTIFFYVNKTPDNAIDEIPVFQSQYPVVVTNVLQGYDLPSTGSFGELAFTAAGITAMSASLLFGVILWRKKMRKGEPNRKS